MKYYTFKNNLFDDSKFAYGERRDVNFKTGDAKTCPECRNTVSLLEWLPPFEVVVSKKNIGDFIYGTYVGFILSKKVKDKLEESNIKSIGKFRKVDLYYRRKLLQEDYFYPEIPLIYAFINIKQLELEDKNLCHTCQKGGSILTKINGITFSNPEQISEDVFFTTSLGQGTIIVSDQFKEIIETNNFTNVDFIEVSKYRWDSMNPIEY
jgi:hypothetical protein